MRFSWAACIVVAALTAASAPCWADPPPISGDAAAGPVGPLPIEPSPPVTGIARWFNPATAPFIPVPEIAVDPNSGTTLGLIPTWVQTNADHNVSRIIAPDIIYNPDFGVGVHGRVYEYTSIDEQWSLVAGAKERVERELNAEYEIGRSRLERWSVNYSLVYDRDGTTRFYGIGNSTPLSNETTYVDQQEFGQVQIGLNLNHTWQVLYTARFKVVDVLPGALKGVPSIETLFPNIYGLGTNKEMLNRLGLVYDTRDDPIIPTRGMKWVVYGGAAAKNGLLNDSSYSEAGLDGRGFWPLTPNTELAAHMAVHYLPGTDPVPFWALSNIGGGESEVGGEQPLRGFGAGRYYGRDSFSTSVEVRHKVFTFDAVTTLIDIEVAPFADLGRVFNRSSTSPLDQLHQVYGVGFRGIARPFVVGYVDVGHGSEGAAVFTGLNYPF